MEVLVSGEVPIKASRPDDRVPADIAKGIERLQLKRGGVEPFRRSRIVQGLADAGRVRAVNTDVRIGPVDAVSRVYRESGSPGNDGTELPVTQHSIHEFVLNVELPALTRRQI